MGTIIAVIVSIAATYFFVWYKSSKKEILPLPASSVTLLEEHVSFYSRLDEAQRKRFCERVQDFLARTAITGIGTEVTELDKVLVASSAIIPIFAFDGWRYNNIDEVLLYKDTFNKEFHQSGHGRNILGMVGDGAMHRQMILSQPALRSGFLNDDGRNTGIHEFVHLLDKADGATDGVPEYMLDKPYILPWLKKVHEDINKLYQHQSSDIDIYAATNEAEFFAVVSEYFFEQPHRLQEKHPDLYSLLEQIFRTDTVVKR